MNENLDLVLKEQCGLEPSLPVLAGVSGGADSLCLLHILHSAGVPLIVACFDHQLRPESASEVEHVRGIAGSLHLPFVSESADVKAFAEAGGFSIEQAARTLRYHFLFTQARAGKAQAVAVGHTADDQVETILMHLLRGAGLSGLKGMECRSLNPHFDAGIPLVRPILGMWRTETETCCRENDLPFLIDATNVDTSYLRNRLRHILIPELERYQPQFKQALLRSASALGGDFSLLEEVLQRAWQEVVVDSGEGWVAFSQPGLSGRSAAMRRNLIRRAVGTLRSKIPDLGFEVLDRSAAFVMNPGEKRHDLMDGLYLYHEKERIYLAGLEADLPSAQWPQIRTQAVIGRDPLEVGNGWVLTSLTVSGEEARRLAEDNADPLTAWLDADQLMDKLQVRAARPGERFQPLGMAGGSIKLSDFFINVKLPRRARGGWPVVSSGEQVAWVVGFRIAHPYRVTGTTRHAFKLIVRQAL